MGDEAVLLTWDGAAELETLAQVSATVAALETDPPTGLVEIVPAFTTLTVFYNAMHVSFEEMAREIAQRAMLAAPIAPSRARVMTIPVCYDAAYGPDLNVVARQAGLSVEQVVELHVGATYTVGAIGFTPGFPYLLGLSAKLHTPRLACPRQHVPAGSVAIGGAQTGVYPLASPGGWNLLGRTPLCLFDAGVKEPALLRVGDQVRFSQITKEEFVAWH